MSDALLKAPRRLTKRFGWCLGRNAPTSARLWIGPGRRLAHNGLVGGSNPPGPTRQFNVRRDFLAAAEWPRIGGLRCSGSSLCRDQRYRAGIFGRVVSGLSKPVPGAGPELHLKERQDQIGKPSIAYWRDHSAGASRRRAMPIPRGNRPSTAAFTSSGARNASVIVILTCRMLHLSRAAICSTPVTVPATISSSQLPPRAIAATSVARVSARIGRRS